LALTVEQLTDVTTLCRDTIFDEVKAGRLRGKKIGSAGFS
jgi:hypothetical protein